MRHFLKARALSLSAMLLLSICPRALAAPLSLTYDPKTQGWTLSAQEVPFETLLSTLAARAGFELTGPFPNGPKISLQVQKAPLDQILHTILRQGEWSYGLIYRGDRLQRLILFSSTPEKRSAASPIVPTPAPSQVVPPASSEEVLGWTHHPDPQKRLQAFETLATLRQDGRVHHRLQEGLHDPDPRIRARVQAILGHSAPGVAPNPNPEQIPEGEENQQ